MPATKKKKAAVDIGELHEENLGSKMQHALHGQKASVKSLAKAFERLAEDEEEEEEMEIDGDLSDAELDLDDEAPADDDDEELELDDDDLELDDDDDDDEGLGAVDAPAADDEELELDDDDLDLDDDEDEGAAAAAAAAAAGPGLASGDLEDDEELELDDDDLDVEDDDDVEVEDEPAPATEEEAPAASTPEAPAAPASPKVPRTTTAALGNQGKISSGAGGLPVVTVPSHALPNNRFLREPFRVVKVDDGAVFGAKKERIWDVDFFKRQFHNLNLEGYKSFSQPATHLFRVERCLKDNRRLTLYFFEAAHPYDLVMTSPERRCRFYELATMLRRNSIMWAPSLCPEGADDAVVHIIGTTVKRPSGKVAKATGDGKLTVARMPYEIIDLWFGAMSMQKQPLPANHTMLNGFMPKGNHDVFVLALSDVPGSLLGKTDISVFFHTYLGQSYHVLVQSVLQGFDHGGERVNNVVLVFVRRNFIVRAANIEVLEVPSVPMAGQKNYDYSAVAAMLRINDSLLCCALMRAAPTVRNPTQKAAAVRSLFNQLSLGNTEIDSTVRFDYFFVASQFHFPRAFEKEGDELASLVEKGDILADFKEARPGNRLADQVGPSAIRVFSWVRPNMCRADVKQYDMGVQLNAPNAFVSCDVFTLRPFLSTFGEVAPKVQLKLSGVHVIGTRMPVYQQPEFRIMGDWIDGQYVVPMHKNKEQYKVPDPLMPVLAPSIHNFEYLRLQHMELTIKGVLPGNKKDKKKTVIATGSLSLKHILAEGEDKEWTVPLYFRSCLVGSLVGSIRLEAAASQK